ncbi:hypothetical protein TWF694_000140 [Orbilia ellipsospora]|uniref:Uncharacterized protein n=1 Tax=Orbilia ellipsospora TaxID=2528407 RepID=A0AAV9XUF2_9PEZI
MQYLNSILRVGLNAMMVLNVVRAEAVTLTSIQFEKNIERNNELWIQPLIQAVGDLLHIDEYEHPIKKNPYFRDPETVMGALNLVILGASMAVEEIKDETEQEKNLGVQDTQYLDYVLMLLNDLVENFRNYMATTINVPSHLLGKKKDDDFSAMRIWDYLKLFLRQVDEIDWTDSEELVLWLYKGEWLGDAGVYLLNPAAMQDQLFTIRKLLEEMEELQEVSEGIVDLLDTNLEGTDGVITRFYRNDWESLSAMTKMYIDSIRGLHSAISGLQSLFL